MSDLHHGKRHAGKARRAAVYAKTADLYQQIDNLFATFNDGLFAVIAVLAIVLVIGMVSRTVDIIHTAQMQALEQAPPSQLP